MDEMIRDWLHELYDDAIQETEGAISNERGWQNGADSDEEIMMHEENIDRYEEYIQILERLESEVDDM